MAYGKLHNDPDADRLWVRCRKDSNLKWLLEGVLSSRTPELGRILLLSPVEFFGEVHARLGPKVPVRFHSTGFPYLSRRLKDVSESLKRMMSGLGAAARHSNATEGAIAEWAAANGREVKNLIAAAILETVRVNDCLRTLVRSDQPVTRIHVAQQLPDYEALNWKPLEDLVQLFEPILARSRSKKLINQFTLNLTALLRHSQPEVIQQYVIFRSAYHFMALLRKRSVSEASWRNLLFGLIDRGFVAPKTSMFLWCRKYPGEGFVASASLALGTLPPYCPSCGRDADAMASFAPFGQLHNAISLKDGVLGAAIGWHLTTRGIRFRHGHSEKGTEMDFIAVTQSRRILIECKVLSILVSAKQLARNVREAIKQLNEHVALLKTEGWELTDSVCVVNLTNQELASLRWSGLPKDRVVSYERFSKWLGVLISSRKRGDLVS